MRWFWVTIGCYAATSIALAQNYNYGNNYGGGNAAEGNYGLNGGGNTGNPAGGNYGGNYGTNYSGGNNYGGNYSNGYGGKNTGGNTAGNNYGGNYGNGYGGNNAGGNAAGNNYGTNNYGGGNTATGNTAGSNYGNGTNYGIPVNNGTNAYGGTNTYGGGNTYGGTNTVPPANAAGTSAYSTATTTEQAPPGPPAEQDFQFEHNGAPGIHVYKMKWPDSNRNVQTIEVYRADTGDLLQNLTVPQEGLRVIYSELLEPTTVYATNMRDQVLDAVDYNFDNFVDIRLTREWPYAAGNKMYYIWLYDVETDQYKFSNELSLLPAPRPNKKDKRVESVTLQGWGGGEFTKNIYTISPEGLLRIETRITNTMYDKQRLWFVRDVRTRVNGELQRVCKFLMRTEGVHKRLWGRRSTCQQYLVKGPPATKGR